MSVYRVTELVGTSSQSWEDAAGLALTQAQQTLRDLRVAEVVEQDRGLERPAVPLDLRHGLGIEGERDRDLAAAVVVHRHLHVGVDATGAQQRAAAQREQQLPHAAILAAGAIALAPPPARASVITDSPSLPLLGVPYVSSSGSCFPALSICVSDGTSTLTSPVVSSFELDGQHITSGVTFSATLTDLADNPLAPVELTGTVEQVVLGRTSDTETGTWNTELVSLSLGLPATFLLGGLARADKPVKVPVAHGDVLVWGGASRLRYHGVAMLAEGAHPRLGPRRINLSFRRAG